LPTPRRHHGCGSFTTTQNITVLVIFGGISRLDEYLNDILILKMKNQNAAWTHFQYGNLPYSNIILKSFVMYLDAKKCELTFVGIDGIYTCKKNFIWTRKELTKTNNTKLWWTGLARLRRCWRNY